MIKKALVEKIFDAASMQRWNDRIRPMEFYELDKQSHKLVIAFFLGHFSKNDPKFSWRKLISGAVYEFFQRIIITDLKPTVYYRIKENAQTLKALNGWVYEEIKDILKDVSPQFAEGFLQYHNDLPADHIIKRILSASHIYASWWEYQILAPLNQNAYDREIIESTFTRWVEDFNELPGMQQLRLNHNYKKFIDLCGHLRFQNRWSNMSRTPRTSVLGHSLFVAMLSYFFSLELSATDTRLYQNFFTGLFHDLPEVLTRDVISPVKRSIPGLEELVKGLEKEQMEQWIYALLPDFIGNELRFFCEEEFSDVLRLKEGNKKVSLEEIQKSYNLDEFAPRDGSLVKCADILAAFIEAVSAVKNGSRDERFFDAIKNMFALYRDKKLGDFQAGELFKEFYDSLKGSE